ncbi:OmpA family protein [Salinispirillum marinum]|uniref:OmpA family protein n=2 Tax=Saccharospirillaceae TaxID=255527 RepID=A0ABV8BHD9_9GAMM
MSSGRRTRSNINVWPGYVDALSALLMLVIFMLMVYMVTQLFLSQTVSDRDAQLATLSQRLSEITRQLGLQEQRTATLQTELVSLQEDYALSEARNARLQGDNAALLAAQDELLAAATDDQDTINTLLLTQASLQQDIATLQALRDQLEQDIANQIAQLQARDAQIDELTTTVEALRDRTMALSAELAAEQERTLLAQRTLEDREIRIDDLLLLVQQNEAALSSEQALTTEQRLQLQALSNQITQLQEQLSTISAALRLQEDISEQQETELAELGQRLNVLLAERVNELERYQSDFFRRLRDALEGDARVQIVGDRFVLPAELLFASGQANIGAAGEAELNELATVLLDLINDIPADVDWILRVDGHTDRIPISTASFASNWELSTARALSVVRYLAAQGIPEQRLAATGFGEFQPVDNGNSPEALQRNRRIEIKLTNR